MSTQHTPGPWIYADNGLCRNKAGESQYTFGPSMGCVGVVLNRTSSGGPGTEEEANARLVAAAPELLSALESVYLIALSKVDLASKLECNALEQARAAIAKATGGAAK